MTPEQKNLFEAVMACGATMAVGRDLHGDPDIYAVVPDGYKLVSLEDYEEVPRRKRGEAAMDDLDSLIAYVNEHKNPDSRAFVSRTTGAVGVILDFHGAAADWMTHLAKWTPVPSSAWTAWTASNTKSMSQQAFAEFVEDRLRDFDNPPGGEMYDIATTLTATGQLNFRQATRLDNNTVRLAYDETIDAKAGQRGELVVPQQFALAIELFPGLGMTLVHARLRYRIRDGELTFLYKIEDLETIKLEAVGRIAEKLKAETGLNVFLGQFTPHAA